MGRIQSLRPMVQTIDTRTARAQPITETRLSGRRNQSRRWRLWKADPHCAHCRRLVAFPEGFQIDHIIPLYKGGEDADRNCQVLCVGPDGCHEKKTAADVKAE